MAGSGRRRYPDGILEAAQRGDEKALDQLLGISQKDIYRYARFTCQVGDVHDAVQESLWILYRKVGGVRTLGALAGWLFTVVRRECLRLAKRGRAGQQVGIEAVEDDLRFARMPQDELRLDLARAMRGLPEHYRDLVLRVDVQEIPIGEVALELGLTRESAKARLHRARLLLREALLHE